jgi:lipopolysaccharide export system permease protein
MKKTFFMFFSALMSLIILLVIAQLFGQLTTFAEFDTGILTILEYLVFSIPKMMNLLLPFSLCLGILATQAALARHSEIIAMQSCSVTLMRIYIPFIVMGILATFLMAATSFYLYPLGQREADRIENITIKKGTVTGTFTMAGSRFKVDNDIYGVDNLDVAKGVMDHVICYRFASGRLIQVYKADKACWNGKSWDATNLKIIDLGPSGIVGPRTAGHLPLAREPEDLVMAKTNPEVLTQPDLRDYIQQLRNSGNSSPTAETFYYSRISFALAPLIITLLVIPFGMRFPRAGGIAKGIILGMILGLSYWGLHSGMTGLGSSGIMNPLLASWGANIIALVIAFTILLKKRRAIYG